MSTPQTLVIFDLDNTLVHSRIDFAGMRRAVAGLLREFDVTQETDEELRTYSIGQLIARGAAVHASLEEIAWREIADFERRGMAESTVEDDAAPTLKVLSQRGFRLAVLTNNARPATLEALEKFYLLPYFDLILTRNEVPLKPDSGGIIKAKSTFAPKSTFHVGDAWMDGAAANSASVPYIAFRPQMESFAERDITIWNTVQQLAELEEIL